MTVHKTHAHLRRVLVSIATDYHVPHLSADMPVDVIRWCDGVLRGSEPRERKGHGLSRLDAKRTSDEIGHLRGCAYRFVDALNRAVRQHEQNIVAHNRRARDRGRKLRAQKARMK